MSDEETRQEEIRAQLVDDPTTQKIAALLEVSVEDYVLEVMHYAANPDLDPEVFVLPDDVLRQRGVVGPTEHELLEWLRSLGNGDGIEAEAPSERAREAAGTAAIKDAPSVSDRRGQILASSDLKAQIQSMRHRPRRVPGVNAPGGRT